MSATPSGLLAPLSQKSIYPFGNTEHQEGKPTLSEATDRRLTGTTPQGSTHDGRIVHFEPPQPLLL